MAIFDTTTINEHAIMTFGSQITRWKSVKGAGMFNIGSQMAIDCWVGAGGARIVNLIRYGYQVTLFISTPGIFPMAKIMAAELRMSRPSAATHLGYNMGAQLGNHLTFEDYSSRQAVVERNAEK
ncbi:hypothetical protein F4776DRAFT_667612 [Hypoxylon sp. NC0597]|nr:hypothetical protein F4776DRAFT_667612 [Hypoxylon sp. NC0597]